jgi:hypothetical protein
LFAVLAVADPLSEQLPYYKREMLNKPFLCCGVEVEQFSIFGPSNGNWARP